MSTPAQITICGALKTETIAALVELAMTAGAALMVQPRALAATPADVVEASSPRRKALPPARRAVARPRAATKSPAAEASLDDRLRRVLKDGPVALKELRRVTSIRHIRQLVAAGAIVATGVTNARRFALPGHSAKEAP